MKIGNIFYDFVKHSKSSKVYFYNVIKVALVAFLMVFIIVLLAGNAGTKHSAAEIAQKVVPELVSQESMSNVDTGTDDGTGGTDDSGAADGTNEADDADGSDAGKSSDADESGDADGDAGSKAGKSSDADESGDADSSGKEKNDESSSGNDGAIDSGVSGADEDGVMDGMECGTVLDFKRFFGLNAEDYEGVEYFKPVSQMDVEELLIVKLKDGQDSAALQDSIKKRVSSQLNAFDGYGAAQCALLDKHIMKVKGNVLFYCVSPNVSDYYSRFKKAL